MGDIDRDQLNQSVKRKSCHETGLSDESQIKHSEHSARVWSVGSILDTEDEKYGSVEYVGDKSISREFIDSESIGLDPSIRERFKRQKTNQQELHRRYGTKHELNDTMTQYVYSGVVNDLSKLVTSSSSFSQKLGSTVSATCEDIVSMAPKIVVFGLKGCGKTALLQKLFNLPGEPGDETTVPIEYNFSPRNYGVERVRAVFDSPFTSKAFECTKEITFSKVFKLAHAYVKDNHAHNPNKIVCELYGAYCFTVADLPGISLEEIMSDAMIDTTAQKSLDVESIIQYYTMPKTKFLDDESSLILHVMRSDVDARLDLTTKHARGYSNVVTVITHADRLHAKNKVVSIPGMPVVDVNVNVNHVKKVILVSTFDDTNYMNWNYGTKSAVIRFGENAIHKEIAIFVERYLPTITRRVFEKLETLRSYIWSEISTSIVQNESSTYTVKNDSVDGVGVSKEESWRLTSQKWSDFRLFTDQCAKIMEMVEVVSEL